MFKHAVPEILSHRKIQSELRNISHAENVVILNSSRGRMMASERKTVAHLAMLLKHGCWYFNVKRHSTVAVSLKWLCDVQCVKTTDPNLLQKSIAL
jgi:hypothetical protein